MELDTSHTATSAVDMSGVTQTPEGTPGYVDGFPTTDTSSW
jgi:hypothetical protein